MQDITNRILRQMNSTRLISTLFKPRQKATALYATQAEVLQHKVFCRLMKDAAHTEWGLKYARTMAIKWVRALPGSFIFRKLCFIFCVMNDTSFKNMTRLI